MDEHQKRGVTEDKMGLRISHEMRLKYQSIPNEWAFSIMEFSSNANRIGWRFNLEITMTTFKKQQTKDHNYLHMIQLKFLHKTNGYLSMITINWIGFK